MASRSEAKRNRGQQDHAGPSVATSLVNLYETPNGQCIEESNVFVDQRETLKQPESSYRPTSSDYRLLSAMFKSMRMPR